MKNPTPANIIFLASLLSSTASTGVVIIVMHFLHIAYSWLLIPGLWLTFFALAFIIYYYFLEKFIYRRIKVIYKYIHNVKKNKAEKILQMKEDIIGRVEQEVSHWARDQKTEIDELKKMEQFRRDFMGNVFHELNTPVFNIQGYLETLEEEGLQNKTHKKFIRKALKNINRLQLIVQDLQTISETESGDFHLNPTEFSIKKLISEVLEAHEILAGQSDTVLRFKDIHQKDFQVYADRERIGQVLTNLITNAIKYGKPGGEVLVACYDMDENILVEVTDNGIGIESKHLPRLFERFYRIDKNRSRNKGGTGLGLAIVKHLVEAHEQTVHVRSTPGVGSTFGFTLKKV